MSRPLWQVNLIKQLFPSRFSQAKITQIPFIGKFIQRLLFYEDDLTYLPINEAIKPQDNIIFPSEILHHFIKAASHRWIMNECICRAAENCRKYPIDLGCIFLGNAVLGINPELGRPASVEEATAHIKQCEEAGLVHLIGKNKLDSVWLNVKPADNLLTICNCCECCCLWKVLPDIYGPISDSVKKLESVEVKVNDRCTGCGTCINICFVNAITIKNKNAVISEDCRGCGRCVIHCPQKAIELNMLNNDSINNVLRRISSKVNLRPSGND